MKILFEQLKELSETEKKKSDELRRDLPRSPHKISGDFIAILGRQNKPTDLNTCLKPLWGGFYVKIGNLEMMVDPGINTLYRAEKLGINLAKTNVLFISHSHIDHKNDSNVVLEMASYKDSQKTTLLLSKKTLEDCAVSNHYSSRAEVVYLDNRNEISLIDNVFLKPVPVYHSIDGSYGFVLRSNRFSLGYTSDTGFSKTFLTTEGEYGIKENVFKGEIIGSGKFNSELRDVFSTVDVLIFNLHSLYFRPGSKHNFYHSTVGDLINVLKGSQIKLCIIDHFNPHGSAGSSYAKIVARYVQQESGVKVILTGLKGHIQKLENFISI